MLIAAALAGGFGRDGGSNKHLWKGICRNLSFQIQDPYIRVLFGLLASDGNWLAVLNESSLPLIDRMIMALRFLNDSDLSTYIRKWTAKLVPLGRIDAIVLTGWSKSGLDLMENYIDRTGDIQTVALLLSVCDINDPRVELWIEKYYFSYKLS
jgi:hypothetical protein